MGVVGTAQLVAAAPASALRLADALARARAASPVVQSAATDVDAARGRLRQARLLPANPVLSADLARHTAPGGEDTKDRGVQLEQEIEVGGQRGLRVSAAQHDVAHADYVLADRRRTVDGEVRRAFFGLAAADRRQRLAAERLVLASRLAEAARRRARAGEVGALDARLAEVETARAEQERTAAETERARAAARLAVAIGAPPDEPLTVDAEEQVGFAGDTEEAFVARLSDRREDELDHPEHEESGGLPPLKAHFEEEHRPQQRLRERQEQLGFLLAALIGLRLFQLPLRTARATPHSCLFS